LSITRTTGGTTFAVVLPEERIANADREAERAAIPGVELPESADR